MGLDTSTNRLNYMRTSLHFLSASLLIGLTVFGACKSAETLPNDRVQLTVDQSARMASGVTVKVDSIQDSRCPQGGVCIWAGNATVQAVLTKNTDSKSLRLVLGPDPTQNYSWKSDSTGVVLEGTTYKVILRDVTPYPKVGQAPEPKQALIQVTQL